MKIRNFNELNKDELKAVGDMFGSELKSSMSKAEQLKVLEEDGVTVVMYNTVVMETAEDDELELEEEHSTLPPAPEPDDDDVTVLKMTRKNASYEIRGYRFTRANPFALVRDGDVDTLVEKVGGFRPATKRGNWLSSTAGPDGLSSHAGPGLPRTL